MQSSRNDDGKGDLLVRSAFARVGVCGNPSDGYGGRTLSATISNFHAQVRLRPAPPGKEEVEFLGQAEADLGAFASVGRMDEFLGGAGYEGGVRLLVATTRVFLRACREQGRVPTRHCSQSLSSSSWWGFSVAYYTNIPRQRGLAGSSAIVTAMFRALSDLYGISFPPKEMAKLVLSAERDELKIAAGLQDRVAQAFEGCVMMDFARDEFWRVPAGECGLLLNCAWFLAFPPLSVEQGSKTSGGVHASVRSRWEAGEPEARRLMSEIADLAPLALQAMRQGNAPALAHALNTNFDLRCRLFGDAVGKADKAAVVLARSMGAAAKLPGSGGAVLVFCPTHDVTSRMEARFRRESGMDLVRIAWHEVGGGRSGL